MFASAGGPKRLNAAEQGAIYYAVVAMVYVLLFTAALPFYIDEAYTANLASDSSIVHMLSALEAGSDGSFPLYAVLVFAWGKIFGTSELSLRLTSGLFTVLFVWHSGRRLNQRFPIFASGLATLFILASEKLAFNVIQARFYGLLLFVFSLAFWSSWDLIGNRSTFTRLWIGNFLVSGSLWLSHPLGAVYGSILTVLYGAFALWRKTFSLGKAMSFLGGPLFFLFWLPSFLSQSRIKPVFTQVLEFPEWDWVKTLLFHAIADSPAFGVVSIFGLVFIFVPKPEFFGRASAESHLSSQESTKQILLLYSTAFIAALVVTLGILDATGVLPLVAMGAGRYLLVGVIAYGVIFTAAFEGLDRLLSRLASEQWRARIRHGLRIAVVLSILISLCGLWTTWAETRSTRGPYLTRASELAQRKGLAVFCEYAPDAFFLKARTSATDIRYILTDRNPFRVLFLQMAKYYPQPAPVTGAELAAYPKDYVYIAAHSTDASESVILKPGKVGQGAAE